LYAFGDSHNQGAGAVGELNRPARVAAFRNGENRVTLADIDKTRLRGCATRTGLPIR
jgi:hypothetical protein